MPGGEEGQEEEQDRETGASGAGGSPWGGRDGTLGPPHWSAPRGSRYFLRKHTYCVPGLVLSSRVSSILRGGGGVEKANSGEFVHLLLTAPKCSEFTPQPRPLSLINHYFSQLACCTSCFLKCLITSTCIFRVPSPRATPKGGNGAFYYFFSFPRLSHG